MLSGAGISMTARPNFEVEGTIYFVFFSSVYFSESLSHKKFNNYNRINIRSLNLGFWGFGESSRWA